MEQALHICLVVWTETGGRVAAQSWLDDHVRPIAKRSSTFSSPVSTMLGYEGITSWISRNSADVSSAVLPVVLVIEPTMYWNELLFNNKKKSWLNRMTRCFAWSLIGNEAIWETFGLPDRSSYEGQHVNGKPHGWGRLTWSDDRTYEGPFRNGRPHGRGCLTLPNGDRYEGPWRYGGMYGRGIFVKDGSRYRFHTSFLQWLWQRLRFCLFGLSVTAYKRLMVGAVCAALLFAFGFSVVNGMRESRYYEDRKHEWEYWIAVCSLPARLVTTLSGELAHISLSPETLVFEYNFIPYHIAIQQPGPITRVEYLSNRFHRAAEYILEEDIRTAVPPDVIDTCVQDVDVAMSEYHRRLEKFVDDVVDAEDGELRRGADTMEQQLRTVRNSGE